MLSPHFGFRDTALNTEGDQGGQDSHEKHHAPACVLEIDTGEGECEEHGCESVENAARGSGQEVATLVDWDFEEQRRAHGGNSGECQLLGVGWQWETCSMLKDFRRL